MNLKYPHLLWPAFRLQYRVQEMTLGLSTWKGLQRDIKMKREKGALAALPPPPPRSLTSTLLPCLFPPPAVLPPPTSVPPHTPSSLPHSDDSFSGRGRRIDPTRKLNPDRIRRKESKKQKGLSVLRSRKSGGVSSRSKAGGGTSREQSRTAVSRQPTMRGGLKRMNTVRGGGRGGGGKRLASPMHWASGSSVESESGQAGTERREREQEGGEEDEDEGEVATSPSGERERLQRGKSSASVHPASEHRRSAPRLRSSPSSAWDSQAERPLSPPPISEEG